MPAPMLAPRMKSVRGPDAVKASDAVGLEVQPVVPKVRGTAPVELTFTLAVAGASAASSSSTLTLAQPSRGTLTDEGVALGRRLFNDAALTPMGAPTVGVVATAKRDLSPGDVIDAIGGYDTYGQADNIEAIVAEGLLPMGLAEGTKVKRAVQRDATITYADVEIPAGRRIDAVYAEMLDTFGLNKRAAA
jgi:hypothetical protein